MIPEWWELHRLTEEEKRELALDVVKGVITFTVVYILYRNAVKKLGVKV